MVTATYPRRENLDKDTCGCWFRNGNLLPYLELLSSVSVVVIPSEGFHSLARGYPCVSARQHGLGECGCRGVMIVWISGDAAWRLTGNGTGDTVVKIPGNTLVIYTTRSAPVHFSITTYKA